MSVSSNKKRKLSSTERNNKHKSVFQLDDNKISKNEPCQPQTIPPIPIITNEWVSASKTRNFILKDPILDWLNLYGVKKGFVPDDKHPSYDKRLDFGKFIMGQGNAFEALIMTKLKDKFGTSLVEVKPNSFTIRMKDTLNLMKSGTPFIAQGMIFDSISKTYGIPDLIVRSDYLNQLTENPVISIKQQGSNFNIGWHYRIVDIKFSTLKLKANFTTLLNVGSQKAYKAQMYVYNNCLAHIQGFNPGKSYLLGRGWEATKKGTLYCSGSPFSKLGVVDFKDDDIDVCDDAIQAITWWRRLSSNGESWNIFPEPSVPELYPNMSNDSSAGWDGVKSNLAKLLKEITLIWQAGPSARESAHASNVYTWDNPDCCADILGISGPKMKPMVDKVLKVNKGSDPILPVKIQSDMYDWRTPHREFFIDFENVTSIFNLEDNTCNMIYMIGIGWIDKDKWNYKAIVTNGLDIKQEEIIIREFLNMIGTIADVDICPGCNSEIIFSRNHHECAKCSWKYCSSVGWWDGLQQCKCTEFTVEKEYPIKLYHYSQAESSMLNKALGKIKFDDSAGDKRLVDIKTRIQLCDLFKLIKEEPVIVRGALDFSLKSIVSALKEQGKINVSYDVCKVKSGCDGLLAAIVAASQTEVSFREHDLICASIEYNEKDCKSLYEILNFFRSSM